MKVIMHVGDKMSGGSLCYNKHMRNNKVRTGFTLVELSLSIVFIAILSVAVAIIVTNAISSYHRGIILNQINTSGMEIVDDMRASIQNASAQSVKSECGSVYEESSTGSALGDCEENGGRNFVVVTKKATVRMGNNSFDAPIYGALCTGNYSYVWRSGYYYSEDVDNDQPLPVVKVTYRKRGSNETTTRDDFKLLKIHDENRAVCIVATGDNYSDGASNASGEIDISKSDYGGDIDEDPYDLIWDNSGLALYNLSAAEPASSMSIDSMFYTASFILGTVSGGINVMSSGDFCTPPGGANSGVENFNYCAINKFNFAAEANGG